MTRQAIAILGSTGSIGQSALAVVAAHPDRLRVVALAAGENAARFAEQVAQFTPDTIAMPRRAPWPTRARAAARGARADVPERARGLIAVATHPDADVVLFASSGTAALDAVLAAIEAGKTIALANKEILVMAGAIVMAAARRARRRRAAGRQRAQRHPPVPARPRRREVRRLILTASGGPFRDLPADDARAASRRRKRCATRRGDGAEDHDRFGDADEQGARGDRGALAVRRRRRSTSTCSCTRSRSSTRWSSSSTDRSSRSLASPTCGCRFSMRFRIRSAGARRCRRSIWRARGRLDFEAPDTAQFPVPRPGVSCAAGRRRAADRAERRQRGRRVGVSGRRLGFTGDPRRHPAGDGRVRARTARPRVDPGLDDVRARRPLGAGVRRPPSVQRLGVRSRISDALRGHHVTSILAFRLRPRRADLRARARAFPDGPAHRRARADVLAGVRPEAARVHARRHRILHQRDSARRLREDGGREPRRRAHRRAPTSSCRRRSGSGSRSW